MPDRSRFPLRRRVASAALVVLAPVAAGCGFDIQTDAAYQPAQGANDRASSVDVLGAVVVSDTPGTGRLVATFVNRASGTDQVTGISGRTVTVTGPSSIEVPAYSTGFANLADSSIEPVIVKDPNIDAGYYVRLRFSFADAAATTLNVPVVAADGPYADLAPQQSGASSPGAEIASRGSQGALQDDSADEGATSGGTQ